MPWVYCCHEPVRFDGERVAIGSRVEAFSASDDIIATDPDRDLYAASFVEALLLLLIADASMVQWYYLPELPWFVLQILLNIHHAHFLPKRRLGKCLVWGESGITIQCPLGLALAPLGLTLALASDCRDWPRIALFWPQILFSGGKSIPPPF